MIKGSGETQAQNYLHDPPFSRALIHFGSRGNERKYRTFLCTFFVTVMVKLVAVNITHCVRILAADQQIHVALETYLLKDYVAL